MQILICKNKEKIHSKLDAEAFGVRISYIKVQVEVEKIKKYKYLSI